MAVSNGDEDIAGVRVNIGMNGIEMDTDPPKRLKDGELVNNSQSNNRKQKLSCSEETSDLSHNNRTDGSSYGESTSNNWSLDQLLLSPTGYHNSSAVNTFLPLDYSFRAKPQAGGQLENGSLPAMCGPATRERFSPGSQNALPNSELEHKNLPKKSNSFEEFSPSLVPTHPEDVDTKSSEDCDRWRSFDRIRLSGSKTSADTVPYASSMCTSDTKHSDAVPAMDSVPSENSLAVPDPVSPTERLTVQPLFSAQVMLLTGPPPLVKVAPSTDSLTSSLIHGVSSDSVPLQNTAPPTDCALSSSSVPSTSSVVNTSSVVHTSSVPYAVPSASSESSASCETSAGDMASALASETSSTCDPPSSTEGSQVTDPLFSSLSEDQDKDPTSTSSSLCATSQRTEHEGGGQCDVLPRLRRAFTKDQVARMEQMYSMDKYITRHQRQVLADDINVPQGAIKVWFQNRRMKDKRHQKTCMQILSNPEFRALLTSAGAAQPPPAHGAYPLSASPLLRPFPMSGPRSSLHALSTLHANPTAADLVASRQEVTSPAFGVGNPRALDLLTRRGQGLPPLPEHLESSLPAAAFRNGTGSSLLNLAPSVGPSPMEAAYAALGLSPMFNTVSREEQGIRLGSPSHCPCKQIPGVHTYDDHYLMTVAASTAAIPRREGEQ